MAIEKRGAAEASPHIGSRIKNVRRSMNMNQKEFAEMVSVSQGHLSDIENGKGKPTLEMIIKMMTNCGDINMRWLLMGEGEIYVQRFPAGGIDMDVLSIAIEFVEKTRKNSAREGFRSLSTDIHSLNAIYEVERNHLYALMHSGVPRAEAVPLLRIAHGLPGDAAILESEEWQEHRGDDTDAPIPAGLIDIGDAIKPGDLKRAGSGK